MGWSGGVFSRIHSWVDDYNAAIDILPDRHDAEDDNLSAGINACINKDGSNAFTGNADLGSHKIINVAAGSSTTDAATIGGAETLTNKQLTTPKINEAVNLTVTSTELNALDGITATTAELNILDGVTATASELNALDGITATTAELNILDGVSGAVSGYLGGVYQQIEDDSGKALAPYAVDSVIGAAWETIGPTGSGATNIYTAMNDIPSDAKWAEFQIKVYADNAAATADTYYYVQAAARSNGSSRNWTLCAVAACQCYSNNVGGFAMHDTSVFKIPLDGDNTFEMYIDENVVSPNVDINLVGWGM